LWVGGDERKSGAGSKGIKNGKMSREGNARADGDSLHTRESSRTKEDQGVYTQLNIELWRAGED